MSESDAILYVGVAVGAVVYWVGYAMGYRFAKQGDE